MPIVGKYPQTRLRRTRQFDWSRNLRRENQLSINDFILALFICEGTNIKNECPSMSEVFIYSTDMLIQELTIFIKNGLQAIMLFPRTPQEKKSDDAKEALNPENLMCGAIREIKNKFPSLGIICDVALDPYITNGHDGITDQSGYVLNNETVEILCKQSLNLAEAGCDVVAPSDMMDGRIGEIRKYLDANSKQNTQIMSYAVKFASSFYGPFRDSVGSTQKTPICKKTYQMDYGNSDEAMVEIQQDIEEGADYIIIKPSLIYLDIIRSAKNNFQIPIVAYNVSGEYAMLMNGVKEGLFNRTKIFEEVYLSMKRAGAKIIIVYNFGLIIEIVELKINYNQVFSYLKM
jgi:porphobilinogen synthase